jgi:hypothetical protein
MYNVWQETFMGKTKITFRVDEEAYESAKKYASRHGTTVTDLVTQFFRSLGKSKNSPSRTPIMDELAGSLSPDTRIEEYHDYLKRKYLNRSE